MLVATYDLVLCQGVLMYLDDPEPALAGLAAATAPGGVLSLVVRNREAMALRHAMRRQWAKALAAFDETGYVNELGVAARADTVDDLTRRLAGHGLAVERWHGVRVLSDGVPLEEPVPPPDELATLLAAEERAGSTDPYRGVGPLRAPAGPAAARPERQSRARCLGAFLAVLAGSRSTTSPSASSIRFIASTGISTPAASTFSTTCSGREAPMIAEATLSFCSTQATASWAIVRSELVGDRLELLDAAEDVVGHEPRDHVGATLLVGGARAGRRRLPRQVLAREHALGDRRPDDLRDTELAAASGRPGPR